MEFHVLGNVEVVRGDDRLPLRGPKQRLVPASLIAPSGTASGPDDTDYRATCNQFPIEG